MSLLTKATLALSDLGIDVDKDWLGYLIKNLGTPVDDTDALRKQDAILKALLTTQGQMIYASAAGTPAVLAPPVAEKILRHPGGAAAPDWIDAPSGGPDFWNDFLHFNIRPPTPIEPFANSFGYGASYGGSSLVDSRLEYIVATINNGAAAGAAASWYFRAGYMADWDKESRLMTTIRVHHPDHIYIWVIMGYS